MLYYRWSPSLLFILHKQHLLSYFLLFLRVASIDGASTLFEDLGNPTPGGDDNLVANLGGGDGSAASEDELFAWNDDDPVIIQLPTSLDGSNLFLHYSGRESESEDKFDSDIFLAVDCPLTNTDTEGLQSRNEQSSTCSTTNNNNQQLKFLTFQ